MASKKALCLGCSRPLGKRHWPECVWVNLNSAFVKTPMRVVELKDCGNPCQACGEPYQPNVMVQLHHRHTGAETREVQMTLCRSCERRVWFEPEEKPKLSERDWIAYRRAMIECGRHSGIPGCCVAYFIQYWQPLCMTYTPEAEEAINERNERCPDGYNYVPCEECLANGDQIELRTCPDNCALSGARTHKHGCNCDVELSVQH
jgi:hypothetical protein